MEFCTHIPFVTRDKEEEALSTAFTNVYRNLYTSDGSRASVEEMNKVKSGIQQPVINGGPG